MSELNELGLKFGTDKASNYHGYLTIYEKLLEPLKLKEFNLFEIGWGGYTFPDRGGNSARMWAEYFPNANILCLEKYKKDPIPEDSGIVLFEGEEDDEKTVSEIMTTYKPLVVLNDASHNNQKLIKNFEICFSLMPSGGIYIGEDLHTSYWDSEEYQGDDSGDGCAKTSTNFFKKLTDVLNWEHIERKENYNGLEKYENQIEYIHFYPKLVIIKKK